jgi:hypothetical protein
VSGPAEIGQLLPGSAVHLLPAGEVFRHGYGGSASVAVCGELVPAVRMARKTPAIARIACARRSGGVRSGVRAG